MLAMSNVLTAGQIPTLCEMAYWKINGVQRGSIDGVCGKKPVTHILLGRLYRTEDGNIPVTFYICADCANDPLNQEFSWCIPLTDYEVEEADNGIY